MNIHTVNRWEKVTIKATELHREDFAIFLSVSL